MSVYFREAYRSLLATKMRTLLSLLGIIIGIGSVIAMVSIGRIVTNESIKKFRALGTELVTIEIDSAMPTRLAKELASHVPSMRLAAPYIEGSFELEGKDISMYGVTGSFLEVNKLNMGKGRFISDLDNTRKFMVLGSGMAEILRNQGMPADLIGHEIQVRDDTLTIIGILSSTGKMQQYIRDIDKSCFIPIEASLDMNPNGRIDQIIGRMHRNVDAKHCAWEVQQYFMRRDNSIDLKVSTADQLISQMRSQTDMLGRLLAAIASISLVVGGVGIMNITLISVSERQQEIGIRRAMGAKKKDIRYQFLMESLIMTISGGGMGTLLGIVATMIVSRLNHWEFFISGSPIILGAGVSILIGIVFGFFPANHAANIDPIKALRSE
jgi:putative ABC transport system permease protein